MDSSRTTAPTLAEFWPLFGAIDAGSTIERAVLAGARADRVGYAFAAAYETALVALAPSAVRGRIASLCATEDFGAHPRNIKTTLAGGRLSGKKRWATLAPAADVLLVVASTGEGVDGRNRLKIVVVDAGAAGVTIATKPPTPFAPEIPHADLVLEDVLVRDADVLEGDGYERYLKPFRTLEDLHVLAALSGYLVGEARAQAWPRPFLERLAALIVALEAAGAGARAPQSRELHLALGGYFQWAEQLFGEADSLFASGNPDARSRWDRDRGLLMVAAGARAQRLLAAWRGIDDLRPAR